MFLKSMNAAIGAGDGCIVNFPLKLDYPIFVYPLAPLIGQKYLQFLRYNGIDMTTPTDPWLYPDPSEFADRRGISVERESQNLWPFSSNMNAPPFIAEGGGSADGGARFTAMVAGSVKFDFTTQVWWPYMMPDGLYTMSAYVFLSNSGTDLTSYFEGAETILNFCGLAPVIGTREVRRVAPQIYKISATFNLLSSRSPTNFFGIQHNGTIPIDFFVSNIQVEPGRYSSSPIQTNGIPVTRTKTAAMFSEALPRSGTIEIWTYTPRYYEPRFTGSFRTILDVSSCRMRWGLSPYDDLDMAGQGTNHLFFNDTLAGYDPGLPKGALIQITLAWEDGGNIQRYFNGAEIVGLQPVGFSSFDTPIDIYLGCNSNNEEQLNGEILSFKMFNYAKSPEQITESYSRGVN